MTTSAHASRSTIRIGFISNFTGSYQEVVKKQFMGAELAVHEVNQQGGTLGMPVELIKRDDGQDAARAQVHAKELIEREQVDFLEGTMHSLTQLSINAVAKAAGIPFVSCSQSNAIITASELGPYTFHESMTPYMNAQLVGRWGIKALGKRWFHIGPDYPWGHESYESYTQVLGRLGGTALGSAYVPLGAKEEDYARCFPAVLAAKTDVLVVTSFGGDQVNFVRAAHKAGLRKEMSIVLGVSELNIVDAVSLEELVGVYWGANFYWGLEESDQNAQRFVTAFRELFHGELPTGYAAYAYSATLELLTAAQASGAYPIDYNKMTKFLEGRAYSHYKGKQWWRPCDHQSFQDIYIMRFKNPEESTSKYDIGEVMGVGNWDLDIERTCQDLGHGDHEWGHVQ